MGAIFFVVSVLWLFRSLSGAEAPFFFIFLTHAVRPYGAIFSRLARNQANSNKFHIIFFLMNLILFGGFLSAGHYM